MKKAIVAIVVGVLGCVISGCYFTSQHPLPKGNLDPALLGLWESVSVENKTADDKGYLLFLEDGEGYLHVTVMEGQFKYDEAYRGFCSTIDGRTFLSLKSVRTGKDHLSLKTSEDYVLVHYQVKKDGALEITLLEETPFRTAVEKQRLSGKFQGQGKRKDLVLTDTPEKLAAFIQRQSLDRLLDAESAVSAKRLPWPHGKSGK